MDWLALFAHCAAMSLLAIGGAVAVLPDLHRVFVLQHRWLNLDPAVDRFFPRPSPCACERIWPPPASPSG